MPLRVSSRPWVSARDTAKSGNEPLFRPLGCSMPVSVYSHLCMTSSYGRKDRAGLGGTSLLIAAHIYAVGPCGTHMF